MSEQTKPSTDRELALTPKEELAVMVERLKKHVEECQNAEGKIRLEIAIDMVRAAIYRR